MIVEEIFHQTYFSPNLPVLCFLHGLTQPCQSLLNSVFTRELFESVVCCSHVRGQRLPILEILIYLRNWSFSCRENLAIILWFKSSLNSSNQVMLVCSFRGLSIKTDNLFVTLLMLFLYFSFFLSSLLL